MIDRVVSLFIIFSILYVTVPIHSAVIQNNLYRLDIVHFNDFHSSYEETSLHARVCSTNDNHCLKALMQQHQNPLLLNAGDVFKDNYWHTLLRWQVAVQFMSKLKMDASTLGNHEFDDGPADIASYLAGLGSPVVVANLDARNEPPLDKLIKPHIVVEKNGRRIGIIGVMINDVGETSNPGNVTFLDPLDTVKREAQQLTDEGVDIIIVLSHCGAKIERQMAEDVGENIDIIVGAHSHSLFWNGEAPSKERVEGLYPEIIRSKKKLGHRVILVSASSHTKYLGNLTTYFDQRGEMQHFDGNPVFLNRSIPEDQGMKKLIQANLPRIYKVVNEVIGSSSDDLLRSSCAEMECALGDLAMKKVNSSLQHVAFFQQNMLRGSLLKGNITKRGVLNIMLGNEIWTMELQDKYILDVLQLSTEIKWFWTNSGLKAMPQVSGMKVTVNATAKSVGPVLVQEGDQFVPIEREKYYQFTTVGFLGRGKNNCSMIKDYSRNVIKDLGFDYEVMSDYIQEISPLTSKLDNRLIVLN